MKTKFVRCYITSTCSQTVYVEVPANDVDLSTSLLEDYMAANPDELPEFSDPEITYDVDGVVSKGEAAIWSQSYCGHGIIDLTGRKPAANAKSDL